MANEIKFNIGKSGRGENECRAMVIECRERAKQAGIAFPKQVSFGGDYSGDVYVCYTNNKMKQLLLDYIAEKEYVVKQSNSAPVTRLSGQAEICIYDDDNCLVGELVLDGETYEWFGEKNIPKSFKQVLTEGHSRAVVNVTINSDGSNPRIISVVELI